MFCSRTYRDDKSERLIATQLTLGESDIELRWRPAEGHAIDERALGATALEMLALLRSRLEGAIAANPAIQTALEPLDLLPHEAPSPLSAMLIASRASGTGPMAAVAGAIAEALGRELLARFPIEELVVENGGDLWFKADRPLRVRIDAGLSSLSGKLALVIPAGSWGCACSSARVGPSLSFGNADAAVVVHREAALADALATALGNRIKRDEDLETAVNDLWQSPMREEGLSGVLAIKGARLAAAGNIRLEPLAPNGHFDAH